VLQAVGGALNGLGGSGSLAEKMKGGGSAPPAQARNLNVFLCKLFAFRESSVAEPKIFLSARLRLLRAAKDTLTNSFVDLITVPVLFYMVDAYQIGLKLLVIIYKHFFSKHDFFK
jgi:hypothetical protein